MKVLLSRVGSEPRADSRLLADLLGNQHRDSMALVERYFEKLKDFGSLALQTQTRPVGHHADSNEHFALLNEEQALFLLALSRNTYLVEELKSNLIMAFREARYGHAHQTLEARRNEASNSGRRLAQWRYDKPSVYAHVAHLWEQLKLPLDCDDLHR